jgi:hypothetical protein
LILASVALTLVSLDFSNLKFLACHNFGWAFFGTQPNLFVSVWAAKQKKKGFSFVCFLICRLPNICISSIIYLNFLAISLDVLADGHKKEFGFLLDTKNDDVCNLVEKM